MKKISEKIVYKGKSLKFSLVDLKNPKTNALVKEFECISVLNPEYRNVNPLSISNI